MAIDSNDVKILIHSSIQLVMNSCWQCLKGHPLISVFSLLLLFFYIYLPSWFNLLFYTSPLVICTTILLRGVRFRTIKPNDDNERATTDTQSSPRDGLTPRRKLRPTIQTSMSRRTFKKRTCEELGAIVMEDLKVDFILRSFSDEMPMKLREEKGGNGSNDSVSLKGEAEKPKSSYVVSKRGAEARKDESEAELRQEEEKKKPVVEWTEEDKRNNIDLGSSDIEWNERLENLIARRRARKMFSMLSKRTPIDSVANDLQGHVVAPISTERDHSDTESNQPESAPSVLLLTNPFDLPYDPSEEKPILIGDGFEEEFLITQPKDMHFCKHESFSYGHPSKPASVFSNPLTSVGTGLPRLRRPSDAGEYIKPVSEQLSQEVQLKNTQDDCQEEANLSAEKANKSQHVPISHEENVSPNVEHADRMLMEPRDAIEEQVLDSEEDDNDEDRDKPEMNPDLIEDDNDERSSFSSLEESADNATAADVSVAVKNEVFRSSVKKVLSVIQKNRGVVRQERDIPPLLPPSSSDPFDDSIPRFARPTKMEERSLYTRPSHHLSYSIASDMQVEVSEASSPPLLFNDGSNSPIDVESLDFDREEDDSDEDLLEASRDPDGLEESVTSSRAQPGPSKQNLNNSHDITIDSTNAEERSPRETISREFEKTNKPSDPKIVNEQVTKKSDTFPKERLQENVPVIGSASTNTEQNIDTYIHLPSIDLASEDRENVYQASITPSVDLEEVVEPEVIDLIPSPRFVIHEKVAMDDEASINSEHNINADIEPPMELEVAVGPGSLTGSSSSPKSVLPEADPVREFASSCERNIPYDISEYHRDEVENSSLSDAPQEDHHMATPDDDSGPSRSSVTSVNTVSPRTQMPSDSQHVPVASPLSATSVSPKTVPLDEMAVRDGDSMHSSIQPFDGVMVSRIPLHDLPLAKDEVCQDPEKEKSDEKRIQHVVLEPIVSEEAQDQDTKTF